MHFVVHMLSHSLALFASVLKLTSWKNQIFEMFQQQAQMQDISRMDQSKATDSVR
jgi:hypothetical protein